MIKVITAIISVRRSAIDETIDKCNNLSNENNYIMSYLLRGDILANNLSSAKCSNTAYGAKPSRTSIECSVQVDDLFIN